MQIIIDTADTKITVKNKCFLIENKSTSRQISPKRLTSMAITTNCTLNAAAIKLAAHNQVPILFFNNFGTIQARLWSPWFTNIADLRKKQMRFADSHHATEWVVYILKLKTAEQIANLRKLARRKPALSARAEDAIGKIKLIAHKLDRIKNTPADQVRNTLMGLEGSISRHYFGALGRFLPENFRFIKRTRRPALDFFNSGLNYLYGMTYSVVEGGVFAKGLDPFIGLLHTDFYKRTSLVFDLIEPVRPLIDRLLIQLILNGALSAEHFVPKEQGFWLSKKGKRIIIPSFNEYLHKRIKFRNSVLRLKDHIYMLSNELGNLINETYPEI
ncbi:MAG TPA: CRISPR-associated endonuclease Cas1 [Bacteroidetes bacterium]|nr:CRISPR-associated endonuclease Cas1 [Bacteroidota bacterium]